MRTLLTGIAVAAVVLCGIAGEEATDFKSSMPLYAKVRKYTSGQSTGQSATFSPIQLSPYAQQAQIKEFLPDSISFSCHQNSQRPDVVSDSRFGLITPRPTTSPSRSSSQRFLV